jgi:hypothetical protein
MELDGEPLVARALRIPSAVCEDAVVASGDGRPLGGLGVRQVADVVPDAGPVAGIPAADTTMRPGAWEGVPWAKVATFAGEAGVTDANDPPRTPLGLPASWSTAVSFTDS